MTFVDLQTGQPGVSATGTENNTRSQRAPLQRIVESIHLPVSDDLTDAGNQALRVKPLPAWKRSFDIGIALIALIVLFPLLLIVSVLVKLTSRGPVLFRHDRYGINGQPFQVWKFRSMRASHSPHTHRQYLQQMASGEHAEQALAKMDNEDSLTPVGRILRCTAIDELPQLLNVLKGEMSLVGPRPDVLPIDAYEPWQQVRFQVVPGLTGLWQVSGKNNRTFTEMMQLDVTYVEQRSWWLDLKILLLTGPAVLKQLAEEYLPGETRP